MAGNDCDRSLTKSKNYETELENVESFCLDMLVDIFFPDN